MKKQISLLPYFLLLMCLFPIIFIIYFKSFENITLQNFDNSNEEFISKNIENVLKIEFSEKKYRFTTFFNTNNESFIKSQNEYKKSYDSFKKVKDTFYINLKYKIRYIDDFYSKNKILPAFVDNSSNFVFYPIIYLKYDTQSEFINDLSNIFENNYQDTSLRIDSIKDSKILNYIYIDYKKDHKIIILISSAFDPDPLYPDNKRLIMILNTDKNNDYAYSRTFIIKN